MKSKPVKIKPKKLIFYASKRCNYRCPHCIWLLEDENFFKNEDMDFERAKEIVSYYYARGARHIVIQAEGEALMYPDYEKLVAYAHKVGYPRQSVTTNGLAMDKHFDFLLKYLKAITISVDGPDCESYMSYRGGTEKGYYRIMSNIEELVRRRNKRKLDVDISLNCIITTKDYHKIRPMIHLAEQYKVDKMRFGNYHPYDENDDYEPLYRTKQIVKYFRKITSSVNYGVDIKLPTLYSNDNQFRCSQIFNTVLVGANGDFSPCCHISTKKEYGNYFNDKEGYNAKVIQKFRKRFSNAKTRDELAIACREYPKHIKGTKIQFSKDKKAWSGLNVLDRPKSSRPLKKKHSLHVVHV